MGPPNPSAPVDTPGFAATARRNTDFHDDIHCVHSVILTQNDGKCGLLLRGSEFLTAGPFGCDTAGMARSTPGHRSHGQGHPRAAAVVLVVVALLLGLWGAWRSFAPQPANARERLRAQGQRIEQLEQQNATLARSDQISRQANADLQATLAERDEEIAGLRADIAFYERFVGATGQRHGLSVHELRLEPQRDPRLWHFVAILTQNLNRGAVSSGSLSLQLEATANGRMRKLEWATLRQQANAPDVSYSFKYFQQVEGDIILPDGVTPVRVVVRLQPQSGVPLEKSFTWSSAAASPPQAAKAEPAGG